jgi:DNA-binding transcriptional regulator YhcF (GntR family)
LATESSPIARLRHTNPSIALLRYIRPVQIDPTSAVPPFEQVRAQFAAQIADGTLVVGTRLPTVRALADELDLAVNTVARAYRELEGAGLVETRGRAGTVVSAAGDTARQRLQSAAQAFAAVAHDVGIPPDQALAAVRAALERHV